MSLVRAADFVHKETSEAILRAFFYTYNRLGFGFLESVYRRALAIGLRISGLVVIEESMVTVLYRGTSVGHFRCDYSSTIRSCLSSRWRNDCILDTLFNFAMPSEQVPSN